MIGKRFTIHGDMVSDTDMKIPITLWSDKKQQKKFCDELNALHEENEELRMDNDIKFWKQECIRETNTNSIFAFELGKAIDEGYVVSEKFKQMMEEWKKETEKMKEKHKRLFE